jgi:hypothetical protein
MLLPEGQNVAIAVTVYVTDEQQMTLLSGTIRKREGDSLSIEVDRPIPPGLAVIVEPPDGLRIKGHVASFADGVVTVTIDAERAADVRTSLRVRIDARVQYRSMLGLDKTVDWPNARDGVIANMGGLQMWTREAVTLGEDLLVQLRLVDGTICRVVGQVARCVPEGAEFSVALVFSEVSPDFEDALLAGEDHED